MLLLCIEELFSMTALYLGRAFLHGVKVTIIKKRNLSLEALVLFLEMILEK